MADSLVDLCPQDLLGAEIEVKPFQTSTAKDLVIVACFDGGGLISYKKANDKYLHTLNTVEGFKRKLAALGIDVNLR